MFEHYLQSSSGDCEGVPSVSSFNPAITPVGLLDLSLDPSGAWDGATMEHERKLKQRKDRFMSRVEV